MRDLKKLFFTLFTCCLTSITIAQICTGSATRIGGVAFNDFNENGAQDTYEGKQANITVRAYNSAGVLVGSDVTDNDGNWFIDAPIAPSPTVPYRIEFSLPNDLIAAGLQPAHNGTHNASDMQFITAASCTANFGVNYTADYCDNNPLLAVPCYVGGDATGGGASAAADVLVSFAYAECGSPTYNCPPTYATPGSNPTHVAFNSQLGTVWGEAYNRDTKKLYTAAFLKRHTGLGPLGIDGIYEVDFGLGTPTVTKFVELNDDLGVNVGTVLSNTARGLTDDPLRQRMMKRYLTKLLKQVLAI
jgi:SdrD B-like domain